MSKAVNTSPRKVHFSSQRTTWPLFRLVSYVTTAAFLVVCFVRTLIHLEQQPLHEERCPIPRYLKRFRARHAAQKNSPTSSCPSATFGGQLDYTLPFPVYYINMDHSITRKERMELDFGGIWDLRRNPAVDGGDLTIVTQLMGQTNYNEIAPFISEERSPGSINRGELGCVLSHLTAVKRAYLEGNEMAMIVEDDITPLLMPFWTASLTDLVNEASNYSANTWEIIQTGWIWGMDEDLYDRSVHHFAPGHQVLRKRFQFGTSAYIISRRAMSNVLDAYFSDRTPTGTIRLRKGGDQAELYVYGPVSRLYVAVPSFFTIEGSETTISIGEESKKRLASHRESNNIHIKAMLDLYRERGTKQLV